ncbi:MAG: Sensory transduction protein LytR [Firmicutes bacterium ADurb.Bin193]|nr:MAG: Sensory transduction protein LytR [Firmicutes bacterium ADurb.Bin193]
MLRAIVIESSPMELAWLVEMIVSCDACVEGCFSKTKGLVKKILELKPDIVFLDAVIGQMDGLMVGRRIRDGDDGIKLIFLAEDGKYAAEAYSVGATDFLLKPLIKERVAMALGRVG